MTGTDALLKIEEEHRLLEATVPEADGFPWWLYARNEIGKEVLYQDMSFYTPPSRRTLGAQIRIYGKLLLRCIFCHPRMWARKAEVLILRVCRPTKEAGVYRCNYTDFIADHYGKRAVILENSNGFEHFTPAHTKGVLYTDAIFIKGMILFIVFPYLHRKLSLIFKNIADDLEKKLKETAEITLRPGLVQHIITMAWCHYTVGMKAYRKLLKIIAPKVIAGLPVGIDFQLFSQMAKETGIPVYELQHGVISNGPLLYNYSEKRVIPTFADYLFLFSDYWKDTARLPLDEDHLISAGYPYLEEQVEKYQSHRTVDTKQPIILLVSQPIYTDRLIALLEDFLTLIRSRDFSCQIVVKPHPYELHSLSGTWDRFSDAENVKIVRDLNRSIYYYFGQADMQVAVDSTGIFEGIAFGLTTYIYDVGLSGVTEGVTAKGYAQKVCSADELLSRMEKDMASPPAKASHELFAPDAKKNILSELNRWL